MDTKDKILESALKLFVEKGLNVSTSAITKDAGVSAGILFHYFPTKYDLIIFLYTKIMYEYLNNSSFIVNSISENNIEDYYRTIKEYVIEEINWGLDNRKKFIFMQIFENSVIADQFKIEENKEIEELNNRLIEMTHLAIEYGYLKNLPVQFHMEILRAIMTAITNYLYENPNYINDNNFLEETWKICWQSIAK